jgi:cytochrome c peroxidase
MLHIKTPTFSCSTPYDVRTRLKFIACLLCLAISNHTLANNEKYFRKEPIFPIPLVEPVDIRKAELGEVLFSDPRLSKNGQISCASCHQLESGGDDNVALGFSSSADRHTVNTPTVFNSRYNFRQNWDGSARTLAEQIDNVLTGQHEFNNSWDNVLYALRKDTELNNRFKDVFSDGISRKNIIEALVEFENTLITPNAPFDIYLKNEDHTLTSEEIQGYMTFKELGCISCHQGINIGGNLYQKFGVFYNYIAERGDINKSDYGRMNQTDRYVDAFVFKVPSLRNIAVTAPYLHDGSAATLEEAIIIMGKTQLGRTLTSEEIHLIKSFLNTLTGEYNNNPLGAKSLQNPVPDHTTSTGQEAGS